MEARLSAYHLALDLHVSNDTNKDSILTDLLWTISCIQIIQICLDVAVHWKKNQRGKTIHFFIVWLSLTNKKTKGQAKVVEEKDFIAGSTWSLCMNDYYLLIQLKVADPGQILRVSDSNVYLASAFTMLQSPPPEPPPPPVRSTFKIQTHSAHNLQTSGSSFKMRQLQIIRK
jgi:hypothetical protein